MTGITVFPGEISPFTEAIAVLSGFIVIFGFVSMFVKEKLFISEACKCLGYFEPVPLSLLKWSDNDTDRLF
jgi:hypothetical protein